MNTLIFDILKTANRLKAAGVPDKQAEIEAEILGEALEVNTKNLVTEDLLKRELTYFEQRIIIKLGGMMVVMAGIIVALLKIPL